MSTPDAEVVATFPLDGQKQANTDNLKAFKIEFPGHINVTGEIRGHYAGCKAVEFITGPTHDPLDQQINDYFTNLKGVVVVREYVLADRVILLYTRTLSNEELADFEEFSAEIGAKMSAAKEKRLNAKAEEEEKAKAAEKEAERLANVGKTCEEHHAALIEENRKLRKAKNADH